MAATATKRAPGVPSVGTYITDCDAINLYRIEAVHRKEGVVLEDCRTLICFMLSIREFQKARFQEI